MDPLHAAVLAGAGLLAGFVNTLAGGGSAIAIAALEWATGSPGAANATNRIAILLQNVSGVAGFHTGRKVPFRLGLRLAAPTIAGGILGAYGATLLDAGAMRLVLSAGIAFVAVTAVWKPPLAPRLKGPWTAVAFFATGIYMGLLQVGVGFLLLALLVGGLGLDLVRANAAKVWIVLLVTVPVLLVFGLRGQLFWLHGLALAGGNVVGAWTASRVAVLKGAAFIRWVVLAAAAGAVVKLLLFPAA